MSSCFKLIKKDGEARRGELTTVHGTVQTPLFMNVGTVAAIKGGVSSEDLENIGPDTFENCVKLAGLPDLSDLYEE